MEGNMICLILIRKVILNMKKSLRILLIAALIVKIFHESEGINPDEDSEYDEEGDEEGDAEEAKEEDEEEDEGEEEGVNLKYDNPFSFIEEIKLSSDEVDREILEIQKVTKKHG